MNTEVSRLSDSQRRRFRISNIGMIFQEFELLEYLNVRENILMPFRVNDALILDQKVRARLNELALSLILLMSVFIAALFVTGWILCARQFDVLL